MLKSIDSPCNSASPQPLTSAFKSDPHRAVKNHFPPQSFSHRFTENKSKKSPFFFLGSGLMHSPCFLLFPTINFFFFLSVGLIHLSVPVWWKIYIYIHQQRWTREDVWTLWSHWGEIKPARGGQACVLQDDWPSAGGVHKQRDQGGGGWTHTVEGQHGVFELLLTHDMIWKGSRTIRGGFTPRRSCHVLSKKHIFSFFLASWLDGEMQRTLPLS